MKRLHALIDQLDAYRLPEVAALLFAGLMLGFFPLALLSDYGSLTRGKFIVLVFLCCDFGLALLLALAWTRRFRSPSALWRDWSVPQKLLLDLGLLALISALISPYPQLVLLGGSRWTGLVALVLMLFTALSLASLGRWHDGFFMIVAISALLMSILCLVQLAGGNPLGLYPHGMSYADGGELYQGRFLGAVGNVDMLSAYWCLTLPLLLGGVLLMPGKLRLLPLAALIAGLVVELAADVDSGVLALSLSALIMLPFLLPLPWRKRAWLAAGLLIAAALVLIYFYNGPEQGTLWQLSRVLHGDVQDRFGSSRIRIWKEAIASMGGWRDWLLGTGPGTRSQHFSIVFERVGDSGQTIRTVVDASHNEYLDILLEQGAVGLILYVAALIATAVSALRAVKRGDRVALILAWSGLAYCLQAMFNISSVVIAPLFWTVWGLLLARTRSDTPPLLVNNDE